jgi:hypothetical protein
VVDEAVVGDAEQPGGELRRDLVAPPGVHHLQPDVLEQLVGLGGIAALAQQIAVEPAAPAPVERLEGAGVAVAVGQHQRLVAHPLVHTRSLCRG